MLNGIVINSWRLNQAFAVRSAILKGYIRSISQIRRRMYNFPLQNFSFQLLILLLKTMAIAHDIPRYIPTPMATNNHNFDFELTSLTECLKNKNKMDSSKISC